ncbi:hypothetical protein BH23CHL2_BH23CHL2_16720 [soil metagenome]
MSQESNQPQDASEPGVIRETTYKKPATREEAPATEALRTSLQSVEAETVMMNRSKSETVSGSRVVMDRSGARSIDASSAQLDRSGVVTLGSDNVVLLRSRAVQVVGEEMRMNRSQALFVSARNAEIENSRMVIFAGQASGEVRTVFKPVTAAIAGAGLGVVLVIFGALLRSVFGRD